MRAIVISGPESSGKSTLTMELAAKFAKLGLPEYARDYVAKLKKGYTFHDVETIARRQVAIYQMAERNRAVGEVVFFDTFLIITKVWFQEVFKLCPVWLNQAIKTCKPHLVLLCRPDLNWVSDGIRENPLRREYLYNCYQYELDLYGIAWVSIGGQGADRLNNAILALEMAGFASEEAS